MTGRRFSINFVGDVMLGRLIDQLFPVHVHEPSEARIVSSFVGSHPYLAGYSPSSPWGNTLPLFHAADANIINLETSVTASPKKWPDKVFNYRMHPNNIRALHPAKVTYATLANNHTLDFSEEGLRDTVDALRKANVAFAGAGLSEEEARAPVSLQLFKSDASQSDAGHVLQVWAAADHPSDWAKVPGFSFIDYTDKTRQRLKKLVAGSSRGSSLKIFSVHWGPNYSWRPSSHIIALAHYLIDECCIDIVHGHSSHHVQGVEKYKGKLIIYGCGDFVDDYALTPEYRNDLSAVWRVNVVEEGGKVKLDKLEIFPTRIKTFQAQRIRREEPDFDWVQKRITDLSAELGTKIEKETGAGDQLIVNL